MLVKQSKELEKLEGALQRLKLSPKNMELAEKYLDLSQPEEEELLKEAEHQDFTELTAETQQSVFYTLGSFKKNNEALARRLIRFLAQVGGATSRRILSYYGWSSDFKYMEDILPLVQNAVLYSDWVAWNASAHRKSSISPLIALGKKDPEIFPRMRELCYDDDACNTEMFLAGMYLHCVKPPKESRSRLYMPMEDAPDDRAEGSPERIQEMREYLEARLRGNSAGLFIAADEPQGEEEEKLKAFIQDSDPGEEFPYEMRALISGRNKHKYRMTFLPFLAFLAVEHSDRFISLIRFAVAVEGNTIPNLPLDVCHKTGPEWFDRHIEALEKFLWIPDETYIRFAVSNKDSSILKRMMVKAPEAICNAMKELESEDYGYLLLQVKTMNPELYEKAGAEFAETYRRIAAEQDVKNYQQAKDIARDYLMGTIEIQGILPYVEQWREQYYYYGWQKYDRIHGYLDCGEEQLYRRSLVLEILHLKSSYFSKYWVDESLVESDSQAPGNKSRDRRQFQAILDVLEKEQVPPQYQIEFFGLENDRAYRDDLFAPDNDSQICVNVLMEKRSSWHQEWLEASEGKYLPARILAYRVMNERPEVYKDQLLACAKDTTKQGREYLRGIYTKHPEWEADILTMLKSPKGGLREMAAEVLKNWGVERYRDVLSQAMEVEKTKKIKTLIQELLNPQAAGEQAAEGNRGSQQDSMLSSDAIREALSGNLTPKDREDALAVLEGMIKDALMGNRRKKLAWLTLENTCKVHRLDGEEASQDYMAALLISYADMGIPGVNKDAARLAAGLKNGELAAYIGEIFQRWIEDGAQAKRKWVLYAAAIHGGEAIVPVIHARIQEWPQHSRGAMAAEAVKALALNGTSTALLLVDQTARKCKFRQVKVAAAQALDYAAEQIGISREELEDKIVPNLGFDQQMERIFDYGKRQFKVLLTTALSLEVYDGNGKALKNLPSPGKTDDPEQSKNAYEAWKLLKKQLKTVTSNQKVRLEQALGTRRRWNAQKWRELFVSNPVMHQFAMSLIWGVYVEGVLRDTFRYMEDGTFNTAEEEEYELPEEGCIGLVHPIELSQEVSDAWKEQLSDYEIVQPIEQLQRQVYRVTEEEREATELIRFGGLVLNGLSLSGKLQDMGWYRGEVGDGGVYQDFYREDRNIGVELSFSGCFVGNENETVVVYDVYFYEPGVTEKEGWRLKPVKRKLGEVDAHYFSEVVLQLTRATSSAEEKRNYPECREW